LEIFLTAYTDADNLAKVILVLFVTKKGLKNKGCLEIYLLATSYKDSRVFPTSNSQARQKSIWRERFKNTHFMMKIAWAGFCGTPNWER
jgi:hypothetical protein